MNVHLLTYIKYIVKTTLGVQCQHLFPALNGQAARRYYTTARPIAIQFPGHECIDNHTTEPSFDPQATCVGH